MAKLPKNQMRYWTLDDVEVAGKTVLVRCDMNVPVHKETRQIMETFKIEAHKETLTELSERGAKVVVISHQSRPGKPEFISLRTHTEVLTNILKKEVKFVEDIHGEKAKTAIGELKEGEILVLENLRFQEEENIQGEPEERAQTRMVKELSKLADLYVCDAFACTHRSHPSMVGFPHVMPSVVARLMEKELSTIETINGNPSPPMGYVIGGAKLEESFLIMENAIKKRLADYMLLTGVPSIVFLKAKGYDIGDSNEKFLAKNKYELAHKTAEKILRGNEDKIYMPLDLAIDKDGRRVEVDVDELPLDYPIKDVGSKTVEEYTRILNSLRTVFGNGPAGVFEDERFAYGTKMIFEAMAKSPAYSVVGGGDTSAAVRQLGIEGFDYVSSGGGALLNMLAGKPAPALEVIARQRVPIDALRIPLNGV
ncbi:MAG: phosphoglycerate kinase [Candidatus Altiarchaeota archaeon]|nr:phosphoglycerate kinase [Candidatus Altiarchaeota archaeon]